MKPSNVPRAELDLARKALNNAARASDTQDLHANWKEFLRRLERVWFKSNAHFRKSPKWAGWKSRFERMRDGDPLLRYLRHARGAEEHGIQPVIADVGAKIMPAASGQALPKLDISIATNGDLQIQSDGPFKMQMGNGPPLLIGIENRGVKYPVPSQHLGEAINPAETFDIGALGLRFYEGMLTAAEQEFHR